MGFSSTWVGLQHSTIEETCTLLGLIRTGDYEEIPEFPINGAVSANGWSIIVFGDLRENIAEEIEAALVSTGRNVLIVHVEEHVMFQSAELWSKGQLLWRVVHNAQEGVRHLEVVGSPPPELDEIRADRFAKQDSDEDVDYISEIPLELAERLAEFRHDADFGDFERLAESAEP